MNSEGLKRGRLKCLCKNRKTSRIDFAISRGASGGSGNLFGPSGSLHKLSEVNIECDSSVHHCFTDPVFQHAVGDLSHKFLHAERFGDGSRDVPNGVIRD